MKLFQWLRQTGDTTQVKKEMNRRKFLRMTAGWAGLTCLPGWSMHGFCFAPGGWDALGCPGTGKPGLAGFAASPGIMAELRNEICTMLDASTVDCDEMRKMVTETFRPMDYEVGVVQNTLMLTLVEKLDVKKISQLSKSNEELCSYYKQYLDKSKTTSKITEKNKSGEDVDFYLLRTELAKSNILAKKIKCIDGKILIENLEAINRFNDFKMNYSVEIDGKFIKISSKVLTIGKITAELVKTADISKLKVTDVKYILRGSNESKEFSSLDELVEGVLPEECKKKTK